MNISPIKTRLPGFCKACLASICFGPGAGRCRLWKSHQFIDHLYKPFCLSPYP